ncbi:hypothetical protein [Streptomyces pseudovenezuelae]|uniref:hypothetical protein n=1 Tax=Streptomyces pseudovenezuelae TaxID=67350 RepID=UPI003724BF57
MADGDPCLTTRHPRCPNGRFGDVHDFGLRGFFMPFALFLLGAAVFAQGPSEFMLSGLTPDSSPSR